MVYWHILTESQLIPKLGLFKASPSGGPIYLLFTATKDGDKGQRWCPDCRSADPVLMEAFQSLPASATILDVQITKQSWKVDPGPNHSFRQPPFSVRGIPTLCLWDPVKEKVQRRFTESECEQIENLLELFQSHF